MDISLVHARIFDKNVIFSAYFSEKKYDSC